MFHDEEYIQENENLVRARILELITESISNNSPIFLIGYNIPSLRISRIFNVEVYFSRAIFHGEFNISSSVFQQFVDFFNTIFMKRASLYRIKFNGGCNFFSARFEDAVFFYRSRFKETSFQRAKFKNAADFSGCIFYERVTFMEIEFTGEADFEDSVFIDDAVFFFSSFKDKASFMGCHFWKGVQFGFSNVEGNSMLNLNSTILWNKPTFLEVPLMAHCSVPILFSIMVFHSSVRVLIRMLTSPKLHSVVHHNLITVSSTKSRFLLILDL
jgi:uncharacterized protein YjbI with pentapeptide repeats